MVDNAGPCDSAGLAVDGNAEQFAKAIGLCKKQSGTSWGLISAEYTRGVGINETPSNDQHGILPKFGDVLKPREGSMLGVLSSGFAREYDALTGTPGFNEGAFTNGQIMQGNLLFPTEGKVPAGFPKAKMGCAVSPKVFDTINVRLKVKVPKNAKGLSFDFNFYTSEWPKYLCTPYNDSFIAYLTSAKVMGGADNISFDSQKNPVSVNNGFFDRCTPAVETGCCSKTEANGGSCSPSNVSTSTCPGGPAELGGTGFGRVSSSATSADAGRYCKDSSTGGGATGWLQTQAPLEPGETATLEFVIWDTGDPTFDSSVLIDNFAWVPGEVATSTVRPPR
jgi:hypothetical protein